ncbi:hypothetical protein LQE92_09005 [Lacrimispora sp. NSJ-141]|uniref:Uncharacterized protein n=1 Tax=Lientehia hominis TaxID=2897778 RepID=A0AAP2RJ30_9FIRM|nr:hypothetical protein [Lientehia hominis]MCD2492766.1 hypothetical protein [Lientehia hominis]
MCEREKQLLESFAESLPKMTEFEKGYILGVAESKVQDKKNEEKESKEMG